MSIGARTPLPTKVWTNEWPSTLMRVHAGTGDVEHVLGAVEVTATSTVDVSVIVADSVIVKVSVTETVVPAAARHVAGQVMIELWVVLVLLEAVEVDGLRQEQAELTLAAEPPQLPRYAGMGSPGVPRYWGQKALA